MSVDPATRAFDALASRFDVMGLRTIGFTSPLLGEGVSTIALGSALSLAALRRDGVLLIDANWLQPSLTLDARLEGAPGLANYLAHEVDLSGAIQPASAAGVAFLPIGERAAARPTLRGLSALLANDITEYHTVIVDLPPTLAGEPFVLPWAALLDRLFMVLREAATPLPLVRQALDRIDPTSPPDIVLNRGVASGSRIPTLLPARA
jgi:polysaccharide biosynthesis transport protein